MKWCCKKASKCAKLINIQVKVSSGLYRQGFLFRFHHPFYSLVPLKGKRLCKNNLNESLRICPMRRTAKSAPKKMQKCFDIPAEYFENWCATGRTQTSTAESVRSELFLSGKENSFKLFCIKSCMVVWNAKISTLTASDTFTETINAFSKHYWTCDF